MQKEPLAFLTDLLNAPSPSGFEQPVQRVVRRRMKRLADTVETDVHGNVICVFNPKGAPRVMLAGHCDQIGLMVNHIDENGFLFVRSVGGIDQAVLPGTRVTVHAEPGPLPGVVGRKAIHLLKPDERNAKLELRDLWIDIGAKNRKEASRLIEIGTPITFELGMQRLGGDLAASPGFDNKSGTFVVMEALRLASRMKLSCALYAVSTVQEEIGLRGATTSCFGIDPQVGIAVDVTHATDHPDVDKRAHGDVRLGGGPVLTVGANINSKLFDLLKSTAKKDRMPHQISAEPGATPTDANVLQTSRAGVATALLGIPNRYMHTQVEVVSLGDLESTARLLALTVARITQRTRFVPA